MGTGGALSPLPGDKTPGTRAVLPSILLPSQPASASSESDTAIGYGTRYGTWRSPCSRPPQAFIPVVRFGARAADGVGSFWVSANSGCRQILGVRRFWGEPLHHASIPLFRFPSPRCMCCEWLQRMTPASSAHHPAVDLDAPVWAGLDESLGSVAWTPCVLSILSVD